MSDIPDSLNLNCDMAERVLCGFIRNEIHRVGFKNVVLGLSGGIDSTLSAYLAARALGSKHVWGVRMPYKSSSDATMQHGQDVTDALGIHQLTVSITDQVDAYFRDIPDASKLRRANKMARERMTILYDQSMALDALVLGTSNKTELLLGYGTQHGDMASAINPIGDLYKTQVWQLSEHLDVVQEIIDKPPTADLWEGQTDENELGFTYRQVDEVLVLMIDHRYRREDLIKAGFDASFIDDIARRVKISHYKRRLPIIAKISERTIDRDFRYPRDWGT